MKCRFLYIMLISLLGLAACKDDPLYDDTEIGSGESNVTATIYFKSLLPALTTRAAGDAIKNIDNLCVLMYSITDGELKRSFYGTAQSPGDLIGLRIDNINNDRPNDDKGTSAETDTPKATFRLNDIPYGKYRIYAVANMGNVAVDSLAAVKTADGLKKINLTWSNGDKDAKGNYSVSHNNQMFGYFSSEGNASGFDAPEIIINKPAIELNAWLKRASSKVTVAYDATNLKEGVFIYLKSVSIKDIPKYCSLGASNTPAKRNDLFPTGETITYYSEGNAENQRLWPRLAKGQNIFGSYAKDGIPLENGEMVDTPEERKERLSEHHGEMVDALYFYENMQGVHEDKNKLQDSTGPDGVPDGKLDHPGLPDNPDYLAKDGVDAGTYVEVEAFYVSINSEKVGSGPIKYRFMLGKNTTIDYDAERNHHYKLTLRFKGFANDVDWHIEYEEETPGIEVPQPYYISYLYNRTMNLPIKVNTGGAELVALRANILTNNWAPYGAYTGDTSTQLDYAHWYDSDVALQKGYNPPKRDGYTPIERGDDYPDPWNGFLSLRKTTATVLDTGTGDGITTIESNKAYYNGEGKGTDPTKKRGVRTYYENGKEKETENNDGHGKFKIEKIGNNVVNASIPMYTRAKQMIVTTGYTGNNPYVAYQRRATVEITAEIKYPEEVKSRVLKDTVEIFQVRRIVNPKGIYRSHNNVKPFHVTLMRLPRENATQFEPFSSEGPWRAEIVNGSDDFITLSQYGGSTGTLIDFNVNFKNTCGVTQSRHAVIRIEYHNYTCSHLIFVRQGSAPVALLENGTKWHTFNLVTAGQEASSPLDEGSLFKLGNLEEPIAASNQVNYSEPWINVKPGLFKQSQFYNPELTIVGSDTKKKWDKIGNKSDNLKPTDWNLSVSGARMAEYADYQALYKSDDIEQGYGVLYGDSATTTATDIQHAYGYRAEGNIKGLGMRGCFVYNKKNCKNVFFPIGASGYGHRKRSGADVGAGVLRYAAGRTEQYPERTQWGAGLKLRPLFYDLYMRPGAIYWLSEKEGSVLGWDINYFTFDFNHIDASNICSSDSNDASDACFIRLVDK